MPAGTIAATDHGGFEAVDGAADLDAVTAVLMVRHGLEHWDVDAHRWAPDPPQAAGSPAAWQRSTSGRAKGGGPTLAQRARQVQ